MPAKSSRSTLSFKRHQTSVIVEGFAATAGLSLGVIWLVWMLVVLVFVLDAVGGLDVVKKFWFWVAGGVKTGI